MRLCKDLIEYYPEYKYRDFLIKYYLRRELSFKELINIYDLLSDLEIKTYSKEIAENFIDNNMLEREFSNVYEYILKFHKQVDNLIVDTALKGIKSRPSKSFLKNYKELKDSEIISIYEYENILLKAGTFSIIKNYILGNDIKNTKLLNKVINKALYEERVEDLILILIKYKSYIVEDVQLNILNEHLLDFKDTQYLYSKGVFTINKIENLLEIAESEEDLKEVLRIIKKDDFKVNRIVQLILNLIEDISGEEEREFDIYNSIFNDNKISIEIKKEMAKLSEDDEIMFDLLSIYGMEDNYDLAKAIIKEGRPGVIIKLLDLEECDIKSVLLDSLLYLKEDRFISYILYHPKLKAIPIQFIPLQFMENKTAKEIYEFYLDEKLSYLRSQLENFLILKDISGKYLRKLFANELILNEKKVYDYISSKNSIASKIFKKRYEKDYGYSDRIEQNIDLDILNELINTDITLLGLYKRIELRIDKLKSSSQDENFINEINGALQKGIKAKKGLLNRENDIKELYELFESIDKYIDALENQFNAINSHIDLEVKRKCSKEEISLLKDTFKSISEDTENYTSKIKELN